MKIIVIIIIIIFIFLGCSINEDKLSLISPEIITKNQNQLKNITESIDYISLENKMPINKIISINSDDNLFILNCINGVFLYDINGKYIGEIGKQGKGPGEYLRHTDIAIDKEEKNIYILDSKKTHIYSYHGEFIRSIHNPETLRFDKLIVKNSKLYFFNGFGLGALKYEWIITDYYGKIIQIKENYINVPDITVSYKINLCFENNNSIIYWNQLNDTITQLVGIGYSPKYLFAKDKYRVRSDELLSIENFSKKESWQPTNIVGSERYLFINYRLQKEKKTILAFYDGLKNEFYETYSLVVTNTDHVECNHWDNGIIIKPDAKIIIDRTNIYVQWTDAYELKSHVASKDFIVSTPKYSEKKKELIKLASSLNENDNPVLMLVKLKE